MKINSIPAFLRKLKSHYRDLYVFASNEKIYCYFDALSIKRIKTEADIKSFHKRYTKKTTADSFLGGIVALLPFDAVNQFEQKQLITTQTDGIVCAAFKYALVIDCNTSAVTSTLPFADLKRLNKESDKANSDFRIEPPCAIEDEKIFLEKAKRLKKHIREGDVFQTVLARDFMGVFTGDAFEAFLQLLTTSDMPHKVYFTEAQKEYLAASPEYFVEKNNKEVRTTPLAGTRRVKKNKSFAKDKLLANQKECAEHNMLVDLARNDLGKIASKRTVAVENYLDVKTYKNIAHLSSTVSAKTEDNISFYEVLQALFPVGTLSGAPKYKSLELISRYESRTRGFYGGAFCVISHDEHIKSALLIRMAEIQNGEYCIKAGAGIVHDSKPEDELLETYHKMMSLYANFAEGASACI